MTATNKKNPKWQCRVCGDIRYETIESEKTVTGWKGKLHRCKGCSVVFTDPHLFHKLKDS